MTYHLIVDDEELNRMVIKYILERNGHITDEASNGSDAVNKITEDHDKYSIIWIDINMPYMDGIECTRLLRNELNYNGIIIGITGHVDHDSLVACTNAGMDKILAKPVTEDDLINIINIFSK